MSTRFSFRKKKYHTKKVTRLTYCLPHRNCDTNTRITANSAFFSCSAFRSRGQGHRPLSPSQILSAASRKKSDSVSETPFQKRIQKHFLFPKHKESVSCIFVSETRHEKWCFLFPVLKKKQRNFQLFQNKCFLPISEYTSINFQHAFKNCRKGPFQNNRKSLFQYTENSHGS